MQQGRQRFQYKPKQVSINKTALQYCWSVRETFLIQTTKDSDFSKFFLQTELYIWTWKLDQLRLYYRNNDL